MSVIRAPVRWPNEAVATGGEEDHGDPVDALPGRGNVTWRVSPIAESIHAMYPPICPVTVHSPVGDRSKTEMLPMPHVNPHHSSVPTSAREPSIAGSANVLIGTCWGIVDEG
jgi:hypothetical protein